MASRGHLVLINTDHDTLISELSRIAYDLNSLWTPALTLKKYQSLLAQLNLMMADQDLDPLDRFEILKEFFFRHKKFSPLVSKPKIEKYLLPYILLSRAGPPDMLLLLFICLTQSLQIPAQVLKNDKKMILKIVAEGKAHFFDFRRGGEALSSEEILDLVNEGCDASKCLKVDEILTRYLLLMKTQCLRERSFLTLYKVQTHLIHLQPFVLNHIVDRARTAYAIGDIVKAAEDIGQYLSFHSEKMSNYKLLKLLKKVNHEKILKNLPTFRDHP